MNKYEIQSIEIHCGNMPVNAHFSYGSADVFPFVIVKVFSDEFVGIGETLVEFEDSFEPFVRNIVRQDVRRLDNLLLPWTTEFQRRFCEALSIAMYDLLGKIVGLPVSSILGGKKRDVVELMPCIFPENPRQAAELAENFYKEGYRYLKTKLIGRIDEDLARVKAIRSIFPNELYLQGDANEGYKTITQAVDAVEQLGEAGLDFFEDPLKGGVEEYRELCSLCNGHAKVTVDLLARDIRDLRNVLSQNAAQAVSLHPCQMGSFSSAVQHCNLVQAFNVPLIIAGTGFTGVGTAAWQHLTAAMSQSGPSGEPGGFIDHSMPDSVVVSPLSVKDGRVHIPDSPGLGVELDEDVLRKYRISTFSF